MKWAISFFIIINVYAQKDGNVGAQNFFEGKTNIKSIYTMRDPFKTPNSKKRKRDDVNKGFLNKEGIFTNIPSLDDAELNKITVKGVFVGKNRRALTQIDGMKLTVIVKEGMKLGREQAEIKAILPGGIVIVEKIVNVYGQDEFLETIIPITP